jgi:Flp pilus assembly pilin Flp
VALLERFVYEDNAQDLVEYALLAAFVATAGMLVLLNLSGDIANVYSSWLNPSTGVPSLWDPETSVPSGS